MSDYRTLDYRTPFFHLTGVLARDGRVMVAIIQPATIRFAARRLDPTTPRLDWLAIAWSTLLDLRSDRPLYF